MVMHKTRLGTTDRGEPLYHFESDGAVVVTGPIVGKVTLADGTEYDVTEPVIEVRDGHQLHVANAIGERHAAEGHPHHGDPSSPHYSPFVHEPLIGTITRADGAIGAVTQAQLDEFDAQLDKLGTDYTFTPLPTLPLPDVEV